MYEIAFDAVSAPSADEYDYCATCKTLVEWEADFEGGRDYPHDAELCTVCKLPIHDLCLRRGANNEPLCYDDWNAHLDASQIADAADDARLINRYAAALASIFGVDKSKGAA